jgi:hypothetical protein
MIVEMIAQNLPYFPARKGRAPPPTFPKNFQILMPMGKQNHFLGDSETPNTRAPLFIFLNLEKLNIEIHSGKGGQSSKNTFKIVINL